MLALQMEPVLSKEFYAVTVKKLKPLPIANPTHSQKDSSVAANGPSLAPFELTNLLLDGPEIMMHVLTKPFEKPSSNMSVKKGASLDCMMPASQPPLPPAESPVLWLVETTLHAMKSGTNSVRSSDSENSAFALRINAAGTKLGNVLPSKSDRLNKKKWKGTNSCGDVRSTELEPDLDELV